VTRSREVAALLQYMDDSKVPHFISATLGEYRSASQPCYPHVPDSRHCAPGTDGKGLAVDFTGPHGGVDTPELEAIWAALHRVAPQLYELIYAGHQCIKNGKPYTYGPEVIKGHHNHVHVSVNKGVFIRWTQQQTPSGSIHVGEPYEVTSLNVTNVDVTMPTGGDGKGWATVHYPIDKILAALPQGLRPDADHQVLIGKVGLAPDGSNTVVSVEGWAPNQPAVVRLRVVA